MPPDFHTLSRRERQILDVVYRLGHAEVEQVRSQLPDPPSYSATRTLLGVLEDKGFVYHERHGHRYRYHPTVPTEEASARVLRQIQKNFFRGSAKLIVSTMLDLSGDQLTKEDLEELLQRVQELRERGE